jgi:hypothetical protein
MLRKTVGDKSRVVVVAVRMSAWLKRRLCATLTWNDFIGIDVKQRENV